MKKFCPTRLILAVILLQAAATRAYGSNFGLPYAYHADESAIMAHVLLIEHTKDLNPRWFDIDPEIGYPTLYIYIQVVVVSLTRLAIQWWTTWQSVTLNDLQIQGILYQVGRLVTVLFGTATVGAVYVTGRQLFNKRVGFWAALALAGTAIHIEHSRYITTDVPCAFFAVCCLYFSAQGLKTRSLVCFTLAGLMAGLAAGTKYNAGLVLAVAGVAFLLSRRHWHDLLGPALVLMPLSAAIGFIASTPYAVLDSPSFLKTLTYHVEHYSGGHYGAEGTDNWRWFACYLYNEGMYPVLASVSALGIVYGVFMKRTRKDWMLFAFLALYFTMLSMPRVRFTRNLMPIMPFLVLFGGRFVSDLLDWLGMRIPWYRLGKPATATVQILVILGTALSLVTSPLKAQMGLVYWLSQEDIRTTAKRWIEENIPDGARIALEAYTPPLEWSWKPGTTQPRYDVKRYLALGNHSLAFYQQEGFHYLVVSSRIYDRYFGDELPHSQRSQFYEWLFKQWPLVHEFSAYRGPLQDGIIRIYQVPSIRENIILGDSYQSRGEHTKAVEHYKTAVGAWPNRLPARLKLAAALEAIGEKEAFTIALGGLQRFGAVLKPMYGEITSYDHQKLGIGWYSDWRRIGWSGNLEEPYHVQTVLIDKDQYPPNWSEIEWKIRSDPGSIWLIGMWPECPWWSNLIPAEYVVMYHHLYKYIKTIDPAAQVGGVGIIQPTPLRLQWLGQAWAEYQNRYNEPMPVDVWYICNYLLREEEGSWGAGIPAGLQAKSGKLYEVKDSLNLVAFQEQIVAFRQWLAEHGERNKPLMIVEYGVKMPSDYFSNGDAAKGTEMIQDFMVKTFDYLLHARDERLGYPADGGRLVQLWAWYSLNDKPFDPNTGEGSNGALFDWQDPNVLTPFGQTFARYVGALKGGPEHE